MKDFIKAILNQHNYVYAEMEERITKMYLMGKISAEDMAELLDLAAENANDSNEVDLVALIADLEQRVSALEAKGVKVWTSGMVVAKGQTVLYDVTGDGVLDYCRYDGGRASTALSVGKIDGWVKTTPEGQPTHKISKDNNGNYVLEPINTPSDNDGEQ